MLEKLTIHQNFVRVKPDHKANKEASVYALYCHEILLVILRAREMRRKHSPVARVLKTRRAL